MFNYQNRLWSAVSRLVDIVGLSLLWLALCLPVVTIAPSTAALYSTVVKAFRRGEESTFRTMLREFKANLKRGIPLSLITAAAVLLLGFGYTVMAQNRESELGNVLYCIYCAALFLPGGMLCCIFPMLGRFDVGIGQLAYNALFFTLAHIPTMVLLALLTYACTIWTLAAFYPIFFVPVILTLLGSYLLERLFAKHLSDEDREKLEQRYDTPDE